MITELKLVALFLSVVPASLVARSPFVDLKAQGESQAEYEVVSPNIQYRSGSETHPLQLWVRIASKNASYTLQLELNEVLLAKHFTSTYFDEDGNQVIDKSPVVNCFYQGRVVGLPEWTAVISTCHGLRGSFGKYGDPNQYYHLQPLSHTDTSVTQPHALYLASQMKHRHRTCGSAGHDHRMEPLPKEIDWTVSEGKLRRRQVNGFMVVEWMVINDNRQYQAFGGDLEATVLRALEITNEVDLLYRVLSIRVVLTQVMTWTINDQISVVSNPGTLLDTFTEYLTGITTPRDSTMLLTGIDLQGSTVGIAFVGTMCSESGSVGLTQDGGDNTAFTASTAAHELGHIFNMEHDEEGCNCPDQSGSGCIMAAFSGFPAPTQWTDCSVSYLNTGFQDRNLDRCLLNEPTTTVGDPVCGNGIREGDEVCDCGTPEECPDPCCNATSCQLREGAKCFSGQCCENCQFRQYGHVCRERTNECDIGEYCSGESSECPEDTYLQDRNICNSNQSYCYSGSCVTYDDPCQYNYGSDSGVGFEECFDRNTQGNRFGNCGYDSTSYLACSQSNVMCGQLHCVGGVWQNKHTVTRYTATVFLSDGSTVDCLSFSSSPGSDFKSPGLVPDGARCGPESLCLDQRCRTISSLPVIAECPTDVNGVTCSGNGQCNNQNSCSCTVGFVGDICDQYIGTGSGGSGSSGGDNGGVIAGAVIGVLLAVVVVAAVAAGIVFLVWRINSKKSISLPRRTQQTEVHYRPPKHQLNGPPTATAAGRPSQPKLVFQAPTKPSAPPRPPPAYTPPDPRPAATDHSAGPKRPPPPRPGASPSRPPPVKPTGVRGAPPQTRPPPPSRKPPTPSVPTQNKPPANPHRPIPAPRPAKLSVQWPPPDQTA